MDDEVDQLVLQHRLGVKIGDQERDIVALERISMMYHVCQVHSAHFDRLPPQNKERLGALCQESCEFMDQNVLNLVGLLYPNADADTVDTWLDENLLVLVARDVQGVEQELGGAGGLDFGDIVSFGGLGREVGDGEGGGQRRAHALKVRPQ